MKRFYWIFPAILTLTLFTINSALAFGVGNVDGIWEYIEDNTENRRTSNFGGGADCSVWATGPGGAPTSTSPWSTAIQTGLTSDENQVRYGDPSTGTTGDCSPFSAQSGFGFDGNDSVVASLVETSQFWLGRFTHYNKPILVTNYMNWVDLDVTISNVVCGNGAPPNEGSTMSFTYRISLEETSNNQNPCPYGGDANGCWDKVTFGQAPSSQTFTCDDENEPPQSRGVYTIKVQGFQQHSSSDCSTQIYDPDAISTDMITLEQADNHACLWAKISDFTPTAVKLADFAGVSENDVVILKWETASEIDNLGFNIYRANSLDGEQVQLNVDLIPSLAPGSLQGSVYEYIDSTARTDLTNYYWLEDVDIHGKTSLHGPALVSPTLTGAPAESWQIFIPAVLGKR